MTTIILAALCGTIAGAAVGHQLARIYDRRQANRKSRHEYRITAHRGEAQILVAASHSSSLCAAVEGIRRAANNGHVRNGDTVIAYQDGEPISATTFNRNQF